jgi:hypothetical protein
LGQLHAYNDSIVAIGATVNQQVDTGTSDWQDVLRKEFDASEGSFLLQLRCDLIWDKAAFTRLTNAMQACAAAHESCDLLPRWVADGFWYVNDFVKSHSTHPSFKRPFEVSYYESAYQRLWDLAYWLFSGTYPYLPTHRLQQI